MLLVKLKIISKSCLPQHASVVVLFLGILCHSVLKTKNADYTERKESAHHCNNKEFE